MLFLFLYLNSVVIGTFPVIYQTRSRRNVEGRWVSVVNAWATVSGHFYSSVRTPWRLSTRCPHGRRFATISTGHPHVVRRGRLSLTHSIFQTNSANKKSDCSNRFQPADVSRWSVFVKYIYGILPIIFESLFQSLSDRKTMIFRDSFSAAFWFGKVATNRTRKQVREKP